MLPVFVINLDRHTDRWRHIEAQLAAASIDAERFPAIDGASIPPHLTDYFRPDCPLTAPQIGCYASHMEVMRTIVGRDLDAALVLEDDAVLPANLSFVLFETLALAPDGWDLVRLCRPPKRACVPVRMLSPPYSIVRYSRIPVGAAGYLVSHSGARKLLAPRRIYRPNDVDIAHPWMLGLDVYGVAPPPIIQERKALPSTISRRRDIGAFWRALPDPRRVVFNMRKLGLACWFRCVAVNATRWAR
jgi:glycosyl transferase family 25